MYTANGEAKMAAECRPVETACSEPLSITQKILKLKDLSMATAEKVYSLHMDLIGPGSGCDGGELQTAECLDDELDVLWEILQRTFAMVDSIRYRV